MMKNSGDRTTNPSAATMGPVMSFRVAAHLASSGDRDPPVVIV
jgi:hypothetical protein